MEQIADVSGLTEKISAWRNAGLTVGFVPTMGDLHRGHLSLIEKARADCDRVVASVFVNPLQFGPNEDYAQYPRRLAEDADQLRASRVDLLFVPTPETLYPRGLDEVTRVTVPRLGDVLCGAARLEHFAGVSTVVCILLNIVRPDVAVFGEKDYQQLQIIKRMVGDLRMPVSVVAGPTVREPDGLALSSRNRYLTDEERRLAPALHRALNRVAERIAGGDIRFEEIEADAVDTLAGAGLRPEYVGVRLEEGLSPPIAGAGPLRVFGAAWLGRARLIDNVAVRASDD